MNLSEHVFLYCERGTNEALLAEPLNAASNISFLLAALAALVLLLRRPREERSADQSLFIALVFLIGLGSLSFHLLADRASLLGPCTWPGQRGRRSREVTPQRVVDDAHHRGVGGCVG